MLRAAPKLSTPHDQARASAYRRRLGGIPEEFCHRHFQRARNFLNAANGWIADAAFDIGNVSAMQSRTFREFFLRKSKRRPLLLDRFAQIVSKIRFQPLRQRSVMGRGIALLHQSLRRLPREVRRHVCSGSWRLLRTNHRLNEAARVE
jgi:hypothetical protein